MYLPIPWNTSGDGSLGLSGIQCARVSMYASVALSSEQDPCIGISVFLFFNICSCHTNVSKCQTNILNCT